MLIWPDDRVEHIARHGIEPEEADDVCFGISLVVHCKATGRNPVYHVLGRTSAGRYLPCVVVQLPDGKAMPITARQMTDAERRRFRRWTGR